VRFKDRVREARLAAGLTQSLAAQRVGVTPWAWYHWESGRRTPPIKTAQRIATVLNVPIGWLLGDNQSREEVS
jgi:DNA-binding XRE family transcriptional regulator